MEILNIKTATSELIDMLDSAEAVLERRVGPLVPVSVVNEVHTATGGPIVLRKRPVISVTSVVSGGFTVLDTELDAEAGLLYGSFYGDYRGTKVTYTAGWTVLPADLERAVLELVRHLWSTQRGSAPANPLSGETDLAPAGNFLLPYRVQSLIEPFLSSAAA